MKDQTKKNKYWLSLNEWLSDENFKESAQKEFVSPPLSQQEQGWQRREFLQLMGASLALASFGCVRRPTEKIVPYVKRPDDIILGKANFYSSSYYDGEEGFGILVKTREGRPIKVEGNKNHPINQGALSARAHSHLLSLYDPERLKDPQHNLFNDSRSSREVVRAKYPEADQNITEHLKKGKAAFLTGEWPSPSSQKLLKDFYNTFSCKHFVWNPLTHTHITEVQKACYGRAEIPHYRLDRARLIVSINCDFLGTWLYPTEFNRMYSKSRQADRDMNRLVVFESLLSLTGTNADWRVRIKASQQLDLVLSLISSLIQKGFVKTPWPSHLPKKQKPWEAFSISEKQWNQFITELWNHRGQSLILSGGPHSQSQDAQSVQIAVQWLNHLLDNDGWTIDYHHPYQTGSQNQGQIENLIQGLESEKIDTVIIHKTNPLYTYPYKARLEKALKKAQLVVYTGDREDETGKLANYILPDHNDLEKWSDWEFQKGVFSIQQPTIRPLYQTRAFEDALIQWSKEMKKTAFLKTAQSWYEYLKIQHHISRNLSWNQFLKTGVHISKPDDRDKRQPARPFNKSALSHIKYLPASKTEKFELMIYPTSSLKDGTLSNVSWLQEFPDPVTKICWDNYVCMSPTSAKKQGVTEGQLIRIKAKSGYELEIPVHIQPGQADEVLALAMGYGRTGAGKIANQVGVNAYPLAEVSQKGQMIFSALPVSITTTSKKIPLANVQGHHSMEGRQIVVETTLKKYLENPGGAIHRHKMFSLWSSHQYPKHKWAMTIDLNSCTGCSACIIACQSENNIPTVGKELVLQGREMHWIRVDRYHKGTPEEPETVHQPIVCMHCDNAPCETVCPVVATVHSDEGTNDMIYNRCVGTRYCANNCPYKVRRFNWFNYEKKVEKPLNMAMNPEVTVRSRGVMEKCTFCIHRIRGAQAQAKLENRSLKDGDVQTACQQSCPTGAIVFGDLKDENSQVHKLFKREDSYALLEELNTKPAVRYKVKVRNKPEDETSSSHIEDHHG